MRLREVLLLTAVLADAACTRPNPAFRVSSRRDGPVVVPADAAGDVDAPGDVDASRDDTDPPAPVSDGAASPDAPTRDAGPAVPADGPGVPADGPGVPADGPGVPADGPNVFDAANVPVDAAVIPAPDAAVVPPDTAADRVAIPDDAGTLAAPCGSAQANVSGILNASGVAVALDGTIYFTQNDGGKGWVGRLPSGSSTPEPHWQQVFTTADAARLALDNARGLLYVTGPSSQTVAKVTISGGQSLILVSLAPHAPVGVAVARDGRVYFAASNTAHIVRRGASAAGPTEQVTTSPLPDPGGGPPSALVFTADGKALYVGFSSSNGTITRLDLDASGKESLRSSLEDSPLADSQGLALDRTDRLFITDAFSGWLYFYRSGATSVASMIPASGDLAFGRGTLSCSDLYLANSKGAMYRYAAPALGVPLP